MIEGGMKGRRDERKKGRVRVREKEREKSPICYP